MHIAREGMDHYMIYRDACIRGSIPINERAIPQEEKDRKLGLNQPDDSQYVFDYSLFYLLILFQI